MAIANGVGRTIAIQEKENRNCGDENWIEDEPGEFIEYRRRPPAKNKIELDCGLSLFMEFQYFVGLLHFFLFATGEFIFSVSGSRTVLKCPLISISTAMNSTSSGSSKKPHRAI